MDEPKRTPPASTSNSASASTGSPRALKLSWMITLAAAGLALHGFRLAWSWRENPFAHVPINDAEVYWSWAARIARGELIGSEPFLSAPLYPFLLGIGRALGADLLTTYVLQALLHASTSLLLARYASRRFDPRVGLFAAVFYLLASDPSDSLLRVLAGTVQAASVVFLLERWTAQRDHGGSSPLLGLAFGLACLANPALLIGVPLLGYDLARRGGVQVAAWGLGIAGLTIGMATLHNHAASGEWIPISAQAGVTFQHGNQPGSIGTYTASAGVSTSRIQQNRDALAEAREALGGNIGWKETSSYFFDKGLETWKEDPVWALGLAGRKLVYFLFGRDYGDIYMASFERQAGWLPPLLTAPVRSAWIVLPGLAALLVWLMRDRQRALPELLLIFVPLLVVCAFWYSPRYRMPALPVLAVGAAWCWVQIRYARAWIFAVPFVLGVASGPLLRALDFERTSEYWPGFHYLVGGILVNQEDFAGARAAYEKAHDLGHPTAAIALADIQRREGGAESALETLRATVAASPRDPYAQRSLATAAAQAALELSQQDPVGAASLWSEARKAFEATLTLDPNDWQARLGLGNVLLSQGALEPAAQAFALAVDLAPERYEVHFGQARAAGAAGDLPLERAALSRLTEVAPEQLPLVARRLSELHMSAGAALAAHDVLEQGLRAVPDDPSLLLAAAWLGATASEDAVRNGTLAAERARRAQARDPREQVERLDCLAAALAETGDFAAAQETASQALEQLRAAGQNAWASEVEARLEAYRGARPWRE